MGGGSKQGWLNFLFGTSRSFGLLQAAAGMSLGVLERTLLSLGLMAGGMASLSTCDLVPVGVDGWDAISLGVAGSGLGEAG